MVCINASKAQALVVFLTVAYPFCGSEDSIICMEDLYLDTIGGGQYFQCYLSFKCCFFQVVALEVDILGEV